MEGTCASYCETPAVRCPNPRKPDSVFCDIHSSRHLANYLKYKKLEANLREVRGGQSVDYYLKLYAKISHAYRIRFDFREGAIAYSARDIGHQIRLDWLWTQSTLCVQHLETIFQAHPVQGGNIPQPRTVSQAERVQARKAFKTYTATKKRVEDYESLIKEAVKSDIQNIESELQQYVSKIRERFGEDAPTVEQLVRLGNFLSVYLSICKRDTRHTKHQNAAMVGSFEAHNDTERLRWGKLAYMSMMGHPSWCLDVNAPIEDKEVVPDARLIVHFDLLVNFIKLIDRNGLVFFLASPFLRAAHGGCQHANIISYRTSVLVVNNKGLLVIKDPSVRFTDEQLSMFNYSEFIENNGNLDQLIAWRAHSAHPSLVDRLQHSPLHNAILINEYYTQALVLQLSVNDNMDSKKFSDIVHTIFEQMDVLSTLFAFPEIVNRVQQYYGSGRIRRNFEDRMAVCK